MTAEDRRLQPSASGARLVAEAKAAREARRADEAARIAAVRERGAVPAECGPDIPEAPARGELTAFRPIELVPGSVGLARDTGHWERGEDRRRRAARIRDVFDRMEAEARKAHRARDEDGGRFVPPLTPAQVQVARDYRDLTERHGAGGMKCASLETAGRASGVAGGEFIDAFVAEGRRLDAMVRRIGAGASLAVRRVRPSARGARSTIRDRDLVDLVCLGDMDPSAVLRRFGWVKSSANLVAVRTALAAALDRMMGYDLARTQDRA